MFDKDSGLHSDRLHWLKVTSGVCEANLQQAYEACIIRAVEFYFVANFVMELIQ